VSDFRMCGWKGVEAIDSLWTTRDLKTLMEIRCRLQP
jgi:hypothetical protein